MNYEILENNLLVILKEISSQSHVGALFPPGLRPYSEEMEQIREFIEDAGEYGLAFESIVATIESFPFELSGYAAVKLLEVGLILKYKTDRAEDKMFDSRQKNR